MDDSEQVSIADYVVSNECELDHYLTLAWMWDTQDVVCPPHHHAE